MYDIAIIGAGPAGATLARLIGDRFRVLLVDKRPLGMTACDCAPAKCCGGLLAPDAQQMLSRLGLGLPREVLSSPQIFVVRAIDLEQRIERCYQRYYINMDRERFDRWLLSLVPSSVVVRTGCRFRSFARQPDGFEIELLDDGRTSIETARMIVGADGAMSRVREQLLPGFGHEIRYAAVQELVEGEADLPWFSAVFDSRLTDYYCWTIPKDGGMLVGGAFRQARAAAENFATFKDRLREFGIPLGATLCREGTWIMRPAGLRHLSTGAGNVLLIGEAGGWISPSSSEGISYAFRSAMHLADALTQVGPARAAPRYHANMRGLRANIRRKTLKSRVVFNPFLRRMVMRTGVHSIMIRPQAAPPTVAKL